MPSGVRQDASASGSRKVRNKVRGVASITRDALLILAISDKIPRVFGIGALDGMASERPLHECRPVLRQVEKSMSHGQGIEWCLRAVTHEQ